MTAVLEMFMADKYCTIEWLTSLCSLIVAQGRIPDYCKSSILLLVFKGKGDPMECGSYRYGILGFNVPLDTV